MTSPPCSALLLEADRDERGRDVARRSPPGGTSTYSRSQTIGDPHQISIPNCAPKRTSPSTMSRMSWTPCRNISARSMPMPKAKPV